LKCQEINQRSPAGRV